MPLYTDLPSFGYYYSGNISPYSNHSSLGGGYSRNPYTLSSYSGYSRGYSPLLSTISESRVGGVSRINSPTKRLHISTPSYRVPKPIRINTADIDVSANKYRRERPIPPVPIPESCIVYGVSPTKSSSTQDGPYMPRADPHEDDATNRSTIKRGRTVVRLSTVRSRGSGSSQHDKINLKRELANDDECKSDKRICKTPGEKLMEKHLIRDRSSDEQNSPIVDENEEPEAFRGRAPSFHDICKDISSDKLYDDLNAGELRRIVDRRKSEDKTAISPIIEVPAEIVDVFNEDGTFRRRTTLKKLRKSTKAIFVEMPDSSFIDNKVPSDQFANTENKQKEPKSPKFTASVEVQNSGPALRAIATEVQVESTTIKPKRKFFYKIVVEDVIESKIDSNSNIELNAEVKLNSKIIAETKNKDCNANTLILENVMESPEKPLFYNKSLNTSSKNLHSQFKEPQASKKLSKKLSTRSSKSGSTADDSYNFWDVIGSRESVYCNARRQRILEEQRNRFSEAEVIAEIPDTPSVTDSIKTNDLLDVSKPVANPDPVKNSNVAKSLKKMKPANLDLKIQQVSEKNITNDLIKSIASPKKDKDEKTSIHSPAKKDAPSTTKIDAVTSTAITTSTNLSAVKQSNETLLQINKQKEQLENVKNKTPEITPPVTPKSPVQQHFKNKISESVTSVAPKSPTLKNFKDKIPEDTIPVPPKLPIQKNVKENVPEVTTPAAPKLLIHKKMKDNISEDVTPVIPKSPMQKNLKNKTPEETAPVKQNFEKQLSSQSTKKADDFDSDRNKIPAVEEENKINSNAPSDTKVINLAPKNEDTKKSPVTNAKNDEVCSPSIKSTEIVNNTSSKPVGKIKGPPDSSKPADASPEKNVSPTKRKTKKYIKAKTSDLRNAPDVKDECELTKVIEQKNNTIRRQSSENDASLYVKIEPKDGHKTVVAKPKQNNIVSNINNNKLTSAKVLDKSKTKTEINHKIVPTKVNDKTDETVNISETESSGPDKIKKANKVSVKTKSRKESDSNETKLNVQSLDQSQNNEIKIASDKIVIKEKPCQEKCTEPDLRKDTEVKQQSQKSKKSCKSTSKTKIIEEDKTNKKIVSNVISNEETTNEPVKEKENLPQTTDNEKKSSNLSGRQSLKSFTERVTEKVRNPSLHRMPNIPDEPKLKPTLISMNTSSDLTSIAANESDAPLKNRFKLKPKDEPATKPLIATPRPLQAVIRNRKAQQLHQSIDSSDTSDSDWTDSSEEDSEDEYFECGSPLNNNVPSMDSLITTEPSYAYEQFLKTSRIIPPATKIPRFRKYCLDDFNFLKVLGKGSFGKVLLAELKNTEYYYAVKCLNKNIVLEDDDVECTLIERKVLALGTKHPYLCHLFCTFQTDSHLFFVMEYLNGGDLMFHIQHSGRFPEPRASFYAAEIVSGLRFLHKKGIVYRDLKLDNILLDFDGHVRIADFGMCKLQIYLDKTADTFCGTPDYMAPEIIKGLRYNQSVDWWSFGVLLYEMLIGQSPFSGCDEDELFWSICNEIPYYPRHLSNEALEILTRFLNKDAELRLGSKTCPYGDVMDQPFFQYINWDRLERRQLEPPFKPRVMHPLDTQYFDKAFTGEVARLTPIDEVVMRGMDQERFHGFSYTNPNATD